MAHQRVSRKAYASPQLLVAVLNLQARHGWNEKYALARSENCKVEAAMKLFSLEVALLESILRASAGYLAMILLIRLIPLTDTILFSSPRSR